jgi:thioredoxin 1
LEIKFKKSDNMKKLTMGIFVTLTLVAMLVSGCSTQTTESNMASSENYQSYSAEKLADAKGNIVLFFHASWCPSCRGLSSDIEKNLDNIPSDLIILKVDYDKETALKQKYGVTSQHTLVQIDNQGNLVKKWSGGSSLDKLVSELDKSDMIKSDSLMVENDSDFAKIDSEMVKTETVMMASGSFESYSPEKLADAKGNIVLFFHASWCPSCRGLSSDIETNLGDIPLDLTILKVNYDTETTLKQKYGVTTQHTLVQVDSEGNLIKKWSGGSSLDSLVSKVE